MRRLFGALLAAATLLPVAAGAQDRGSRFERQIDNSVREARRAERQATRQAQRPAPAPTEARPDRRAARPQRRDDRQALRAERRDGRRDVRREPRDDRAQLNSGTVPPGQFRRDRRNERQDYRADGREARRDDRGDGRQELRRNGQGGGQRNDWARSQFDRYQLNDSRFDDRGARRFNGGRGGYGANRGNWNTNWRQDRRYDWNRYRGVNRQAYRLPRYYAPYDQGYGYRRFGIGINLQSQFWGQNYWIADPFAYRLPEAYDPYRWVRYYDDALLIDLRSGRVVDAVYGIFW